MRRFPFPRTAIALAIVACIWLLSLLFAADSGASAERGETRAGVAAEPRAAGSTGPARDSAARISRTALRREAQRSARAR